MLFLFAFGIFMIACVWKVFSKAGEPGWAAIVPIYNTIVLLKITGKPLWWILLFLIPLVNLVMVFLVYTSLAKAFGKGTGFGVGLLLLSFIFFPILAFGDARYVGPQTA
ncbi:MAG TPA: signal peptidase I [Solibacterales bacterium]|nr:signal peptidase I [Bryobacterales bacterium]